MSHAVRNISLGYTDSGVMTVMLLKVQLQGNELLTAETHVRLAVRVAKAAASNSRRIVA